ncbi:type III PLP-dependent enzyme [Dongia soli]|uniref:ornithine decarboxylase n=1 Tax=Dongia soli TaxID=600628 RepID=A0ABU5EA80_9PROT|nr:type III PLP-dependent enzyme [Dongia soli]MDY0883258.1 type III PLP-dependent enzyme [Dongia soli]
MAKEFPTVRAMVEALTPSYPVYCLRPKVIADTVKRFLELFPGRVLYAVKCNPHPEVLKALYRAGIRHFDTASLPEIAQVREGFPDAACYFMHPVKGRAVIGTASRVYNVDTYVIDHPRELDKILDETDGGEGVTIFVRVKTPPVEGAFYHLSAKFGAEPDEAAAMLREAKSRGCQVGIAFHVGSQCVVPGAYGVALRLVGEVMEKAKVDLAGLDIGGGFPAEYIGTNMPPLEDFIHEIEEGVKALRLRRDCVLMCEPGRALVAHGISLVVQVQLRKDDQLYINDGIYGSLSEMVDAGIRLPARLLRLKGEPSTEMREFTMNGPTCDSLDVLPSTFSLPADVEEGDWIEIDRVGAYSHALATRFNGFYPETLVTVHDEPLSQQR